MNDEKAARVEEAARDLLDALDEAGAPAMPEREALRAALVTQEETYRERIKRLFSGEEK